MHIYGYDKNNNRVTVVAVNEEEPFIEAIQSGADITIMVKEELKAQGKVSLAFQIQKTLVSISGGKEKALSLKTNERA